MRCCNPQQYVQNYYTEFDRNYAGRRQDSGQVLQGQFVPVQQDPGQVEQAEQVAQAQQAEASADPPVPVVITGIKRL